MPARGSGGQDELSRGLRAAREAAGLSQYEAADRAGTYQSKIARVELGRTLPDETYVRQLCNAYGTPPGETDRLVALARDVKAGSRRIIMHRNPVAFQRQIGRIERQSALVRSFTSIAIPGLLQTADYALNVFSARSGRTPEAEAGARARLENQKILDDPKSSRRFVFLMAEGALGWALGSPELMAAQMDHIAEASHQRNARVGIIPFAAWDPTLPVPLNGWEMYDERLAIIGTITATAILDEPSDVAVYVEMFEKLEGLAVYDDQARDLLATLAERYRRLHS
jgi:transcriptional regulator with XRE-family HTH domain